MSGDQDPHHLGECQRLSSVIERFGAERLQDYLLALVSEDVPARMHRVTAQQALSRLFPVAEFPLPDAQAGHCVRCHRSFDPKYNVQGDCRIVHCESADKQHQLAWKRQDRCGWKLACCGKEMVTSKVRQDFYVATETDGFCFVGKHTQDPAAVGWYNYVSQLPCKQDPCSRRPAARSYPK
eukprot:m.197901 g.197901  ORF g.197901 m.197901 type:complete len:181 (-) comp18360_c0_seq1:2567-3109(-)